MATIKSFTDIEQSTKLAEILPLKSADMDYIPITNLDGEYSVEANEWDNEHVIEEGWIPCWSLAALLNVLPEPELIQNSDERWMLRIWDKNRFPWSIGGSVNPVDACYELILKLHEQNLL